MTLATDSPVPILAVVSPKGGNGKTMIAVNLAMSLARSGSVLLVDLDTHFGDIEYALRLHPVYRLDQVLDKYSKNTTADLEILLTQHSKNISVLCSPSNPVIADDISAEKCFEVLDKLRTPGRPMVIDTAAGISEFTIGAVEWATHTILVSGTDVASVQAGRKLLDAMAQFGLSTDRVRLVVNRSTARTGLTVADVEAVLGMKAIFEIPESAGIASAANDGSPITESSAESPISQLFYRFVDEINGVTPASKRSFWFRRGNR